MKRETNFGITHVWRPRGLVLAICLSLAMWLVLIAGAVLLIAELRRLAA